MLKPARMRKVECVVAEDRKGDLVDKLHQAGITQIEHLDESYLEEMDVERDRPLEEASQISTLLLRIRKLIDSLSQFDSKEISFVEDILEVEDTEKSEVERKGFEELSSEAEELLDKIEDDVENCEERLKEAKPESILEKIKKHEKFSRFNINSEDLGESEFLYTVLGTVPRENLEVLKKKLKEGLEGKFALSSAGTKEDETAVSISVLKEDRNRLDRILKKTKFERAKFEVRGRIKDIVKKLKEKYKEAEETKRRNEEKLESIYENFYRELLVKEEELSITKQKCEIFVSTGRTRRTAILRLWVPKKELTKAKNIIKQETDDLCIINVGGEPDEAPILLDNPGFMKPFESLTRLFALPKYNEIDPTILIAPTFCLFFGMMLTDFVYGALLMLGGFAVMWAFGEHSVLAKRGGFIAMFCGLASAIFGLLTGSYFGDFLGKYALGSSSQKIALWMDPLYNGNAMTFLIFVAAIGFLHIFAGHFFGTFDCWRRGEKMKAITEHAAWFVFVAGIAMAILTMFPSGSPMLREFWLYPGAAIAIVALLLLLKGIGFMTFIDIIGIVGDTLSYARILAMALTTAGIALSFNFLAQMAMGIPYIGIVIAALVFMGGHAINIIINSLGAFVHSLRLQYVEHFGTYYAGGGAEFRPFKENRKYTYVK